MMLTSVLFSLGWAQTPCVDNVLLDTDCDCDAAADDDCAATATPNQWCDPTGNTCEAALTTVCANQGTNAASAVPCVCGDGGTAATGDLVCSGANDICISNDLTGYATGAEICRPTLVACTDTDGSALDGGPVVCECDDGVAANYCAVNTYCALSTTAGFVGVTTGCKAAAITTCLSTDGSTVAAVDCTCGAKTCGVGKFCAASGDADVTASADGCLSTAAASCTNDDGSDAANAANTACSCGGSVVCGEGYLCTQNVHGTFSCITAPSTCAADDATGAWVDTPCDCGTGPATLCPFNTWCVSGDDAAVLPATVDMCSNAPITTCASTDGSTAVAANIACQCDATIVCTTGSFCLDTVAAPALSAATCLTSAITACVALDGTAVVAPAAECTCGSGGLVCAPTEVCLNNGALDFSGTTVCLASALSACGGTGDGTHYVTAPCKCFDASGDAATVNCDADEACYFQSQGATATECKVAAACTDVDGGTAVAANTACVCGGSNTCQATEACLENGESNYAGANPLCLSAVLGACSPHAGATLLGANEACQCTLASIVCEPTEYCLSDGQANYATAGGVSHLCLPAALGACPDTTGLVAVAAGLPCQCGANAAVVCDPTEYCLEDGGTSNYATSGGTTDLCLAAALTTCASVDGDTAVAAGVACTCGSTALVCDPTEFCITNGELSYTGADQCLASTVSACAGSAGTVAETAACQCVDTTTKLCAIDEACGAGPACVAPTSCATKDGSALTSAGTATHATDVCQCGTVVCAANEYCLGTGESNNNGPDVCLAAALTACGASSGAAVMTSTQACQCGSAALVCSAGEACLEHGSANYDSSTVALCITGAIGGCENVTPNPANLGTVVMGASEVCQCGSAALVCDPTEYCLEDGQANYAAGGADDMCMAAALGACTQIYGQVPVGAMSACQCGSTALVCDPEEYCIANGAGWSGSSTCSATPIPVCTDWDGMTVAGSNCFCSQGGTSAICSATEACLHSNTPNYGGDTMCLPAVIDICPIASRNGTYVDYAGGNLIPAATVGVCSCGTGFTVLCEAANGHSCYPNGVTGTCAIPDCHATMQGSIVQSACMCGDWQCSTGERCSNLPSVFSGTSYTGTCVQSGEEMPNCVVGAVLGSGLAYQCMCNSVVACSPGDRCVVDTLFDDGTETTACIAPVGAAAPLTATETTCDGTAVTGANKCACGDYTVKTVLCDVAGGAYCSSAASGEGVCTDTAPCTEMNGTIANSADCSCGATIAGGVWEANICTVATHPYCSMDVVGVCLEYGTNWTNTTACAELEGTDTVTTINTETIVAQAMEGGAVAGIIIGVLVAFVVFGGVCFKFGKSKGEGGSGSSKGSMQHEA